MTVTVEMFKTEDCTRCPQVESLLEEVCADRDVEYEVVDAEADRKRALARGVFTVPTVVVDEETTLTGVPTRSELVEAIEG